MLVCAAVAKPHVDKTGATTLPARRFSHRSRTPFERIQVDVDGKNAASIRAAKFFKILGLPEDDFAVAEIRGREGGYHSA